MKKDTFIQFRINKKVKSEFKAILREQNQSMTEVLVYAIKESINEVKGLNTHMCMDGERPNQPNDFFEIRDFDDSPELKELLISYELGRNEEFHCLSDACLICLYEELLKKNELHLLFEWKAFNNGIENGFQQDNNY